MTPRTVTPTEYATFTEDQQAALNEWLAGHGYRHSDVFEVTVNGITTTIRFYDNPPRVEHGDAVTHFGVVGDTPPLPKGQP